MIFKWQYAHEVAPNPNEDRLMMGKKVIGRVYFIGLGMWRAESYLPDSSQYGGYFHADYPTPGIARGTLEAVSVMWVGDAALWRNLPATDTMDANTKTE